MRVPLSARMRLHFAERELRIQRNSNPAGADDGQEPVEAVVIVRAIDRNRFSGSQADGTAKEAVDLADCRVQIGKLEVSSGAHRDFGIALAPKQFVYQIGDGNASIASEPNLATETHCAGTSLRPQSLATQ